MDKVQTETSVYADLYSDALHDLTVQLNTMRNRLAWIQDESNGFKRARGSERRAEVVKRVREELRDVCDRNYRDAFDALSKLEAMVGIEAQADTVIEAMEVKK